MRKIPAKRAIRPNPREDRNQYPSHHQDKSNVIPIKKISIFPKSVSQELYIDALEDLTKAIIIATGPAGTGKTYIATMYAIKCLMAGQIKKIIITRPAVSVDEQHGFLPGTILDKMAPWIQPVLDIFKEYFSVPIVENMLKHEQIEIVPLSYIRGRTFKNSIIICDEMQNSLPTQMLATMTRIGENSRMIITGDLQQTDRGFGSKNGLFDFVTRLQHSQGSDTITVCEFGVADIERHPVIEEVLRIYEEA